MFKTSINKSAAFIFAISSIAFQTTVFAGNNATVVQGGGVNTSHMNQDGYYNNGTNVQFGYDNYSSMNQSGEHNNAQIGQDGTYNDARVNQRDRRRCRRRPYCY
jgi:hypothetical protein